MIHEIKITLTLNERFVFDDDDIKSFKQAQLEDNLDEVLEDNDNFFEELGNIEHNSFIEGIKEKVIEQLQSQKLLKEAK